jgi:hypothetical protein
MLAQVLKILLPTLVAVGINSGAPPQVPITPLVPAPLTKLEAFAAKTGTLSATETYSLLGISGEKSCNIRFQVIVMYEIGREADKVQGLRVEISDPGRKNRAVAYVDLDELDNLSRAINSMLDMNQKGTSFTNPASKEMSFSSTGGLKLAMVQRDTERELVVSHRFEDVSCVVNRDTSVIELKTAIDKVLQDLR